ncbi:PTS transporter subunit EIIC [Pectobacterium aroidearum]|uniref:PTS transporter subunit EIIC n=1 Tax=Pectobacterium aroidearum TaxID=1201031 RepID=UPI003159934B
MITTNNIDSIIDGVGGKGNIKDFFFCATRLRFNLHDNDKANIASLKQIPKILAVVMASGQCQLVIGNNVESVYNSLKSRLESDNSGQSTSETTKSDISKEKLSNRLLAFISGSFLPLIGILAAGGLLKAIVTLLNMTSYQGNDVIKVISFLSDVPFYFMPVLLGFTIARKLKSNELIGAVVGATLLYPGFASLAGQKLSFLGLPLLVLDYGNSVFPLFFAIPLASKCEHLFKKVIPESFQLIGVPFLTLIITVPITLLLLGPSGVYLGDYLAKGILYLIDLNDIISGMVIGAFYSVIVLFGLHWALSPIEFTNMANGGDPIYALGGMSAIAQMGIALGMLIKSKNSTIKQLSTSSFFPALLSGVTEPILYGLIIPYKRNFVFMLISGAVGGAILGFYKVKIVTLVFASLLSIPTATNIIVYAIALFVTLFTAAILVIVFGYEPKNKEVNHE